MQHLLRGADWQRISWWSLFGGEPALARTLGTRLSLFAAPYRLVPSRRLRALKGFIFEHFIVPRAAAHLRAFIKEQKPDRFWAVSYGWAIPVLHRVLPSLEIPYHFSMHDMPDSGDMVSALGPRRAARFLRMQQDLYRGAASRNVVGPLMGEEMSRLTGVPCEFEFRCSVEPEVLEALASAPPPKRDDIIEIGYAGTIIAEDAFALLVRTLRNIKHRLPCPVRINLFSSHPYSEKPWFDPELIVEHGHLSFHDLQKPYAACHWGLVLMRMDDKDSRYNRFSFPCKFSQTLAAGLPMLRIGHSESSLMTLPEGYDLGITLTEMNSSRAEDILLERLSDFSQIEHYRKEAHRCASTLFNAEAMREGFREKLNAGRAFAGKIEDSR